jgi:hypothetical protein
MVKNLKQLSAHIYDEDSTPNIPTSENQTQNTKPPKKQIRQRKNHQRNTTTQPLAT